MAKPKHRGKPPSHRGGRRHPAPNQPPSRPGNPPSAYNANDIRYVAWHEAGHAVLSVVLGIGLECVDVKQQRREGQPVMGFTTLLEPLSLAEEQGKGEGVARRWAIHTLAGNIAESDVHDRVRMCESWAADKDLARWIVSVVICGATETHPGSLAIPQEALARNRDRIDELLVEAEQATRKLIDEHRAAVDRVASLLLNRGSLTGTEVREIVNEGGITPD